MNSRNLIIAAVAVVAMIAFTSAYVVDESEQVVITRFGKIIGEAKTTPGLKFKMPFVDQANSFPKLLMQWDGDPGQIPTKEKTYIWVDSFARWKIVDPIKFLQSVTDVFNANGRLNDIIDPAVRNAITSYRLIEAVRTSNRPLSSLDSGWQEQGAEASKQRQQTEITIGRKKLIEGILKQAQPKVDQFGIELVDVQIKRIDYVDTVRNSVYNRMIAERKQIAEKIRSEGTGEAQKIRGQKERELKRITSEAYKTAEEIKGGADAEATKLYADAFGIDPDFYSFVQTLEVYGTALEQNSSIIMSTDSDFLKYLKRYLDPAHP
ncbi:protease modulator HflC [Desulfococcus sp.]|uniref:protease modulator HflC n=1 Tax=Desulfococcus sp. TaxID=2025834 RepID=UPI0035943F3B